MLLRLSIIALFLINSGVAAKKMNVLILNVDDLKNSLGCYGDSKAITPNIDALASKGTVMLANYCQQAVCAVSRVSMYTGLRPDSTGVHDLHTYMRDINPNILTMPEHFKKNGYKTVGFGKILHGAKNDDVPLSWSERKDHDLPYNTKHPEPVIGKFQHPKLHEFQQEYIKANKRVHTGKLQSALKDNQLYHAVEALDLPDDAYPDGAIAKAGVSALQKMASSSEPFFLVLGFRKPHLPFVAPKKYWVMYERSAIKVAEYQKNSLDGVPYALHTYGELGAYKGFKTGKKIELEKQKELIHGYYACVSYIDVQIGMVMKELKRLKLSENTVVVLWGDHGWHLGDHGLWCTFTL